MRAEMDELDRVQFVVELTIEILSIDDAKRQEKMEAIIVLEDMDLAEKGDLEEAMLQSVIEASLAKIKDDIVETDTGTVLVRPRLVFDANEQLIDVVQSNKIDGNIHRHLEEIYRAPKSVSIEVMIERLEKRKIMVLTEEPIKVTTF